MFDYQKDFKKHKLEKFIPIFIIFITVLCYFPAINGDYIWDDDSYVTENATLVNLQGLKKIWFELNATPQYYPVTFTMFWLEHHLWGNQPLGYHLVNVIIHILNALLIGRLFERLAVPGAGLAAVLFAIHPVHVESVAWISERKNVLSTLFYLLSIIIYFQFSNIGLKETINVQVRSSQVRLYALSLFFFLCALGSKTITCTLPAAILLAIWWKRGQITRKDVWPLLPFFLVGLSMGSLTFWMEKNHVGAIGDEWRFSPVERILIAGRVLWFYVGKLFWPNPLIFTYPRWNIDAGDLIQFIFPLSFLIFLFGLWKARFLIGRGPLTAVLFYVGTLFPALGFINFYPMRFSFVADHFQYLASVTLIGLFAFEITRFIIQRSVVMLLVLILLTSCGILTWSQTHVYKNGDTLWSDTVAKNPTSWMAHNNLAVTLLKKRKTSEAEFHFKEAIRLKPNYGEAHNNLGLLLLDESKFNEALEHFNLLLKRNPKNLEMLNNIGLTYLYSGNEEQAKNYFRRTIQLNPGFFKAYNNLGLALSNTGNWDQAMHNYEMAIRLNPTVPEPYRNIGLIMAQKGQFSEAERNFKIALFIKPNFLEARMDLNKVVDLQKRMSK